MAGRWVDKRDLKGPQGVSVVGSTINGSGELIMTMSNGTTLNVGVVRGGQGLPGTNANPADTAVAGYVSTTGTSLTQTALDARYAKHGDSQFNVKKFGALGNWNPTAGTGADDTAAINACLAAAGTTPVVLPPGNYRITGAGLNIQSDDQTIIGLGGVLYADDYVGIIRTVKERTLIDGVRFVGGNICVEAGNPNGIVGTPTGNSAIVQNCSAKGIRSFVEVRYANDARVLNNTATGITQSGVVFWGGDANPVNPTYPGAFTYGVVGGLVEGNHFTGFVNGPLISSPCWTSCAYGVRVKGNYFNGFMDTGIDFEGSQACIAEGNVVIDCSNGNLVTVWTSINCKFDNNLSIITLAMSNNFPRSCIRLEAVGSAAGNVFSNNTLIMARQPDGNISGFGVYVTKEGSTLSRISNTKISIVNNVFYDCNINVQGLEGSRIVGNSVKGGNIELSGCKDMKVLYNEIDVLGPSTSPSLYMGSPNVSFPGTKYVVKGNVIRKNNGGAADGGITVGNIAGAGALNHVITDNLVCLAVTVAVADATIYQARNDIIP